MQESSWAVWPELGPHTVHYVESALHSGRWAVSSRANGAPLYEQQFAREFAAYLGAETCVPTDHGSSALVVALEALRMPAGSRVVVPALTWVATATAVLRAGHVPVLADVDTKTGCMTVQTLEAAITAETRAVIVVHWAAYMADMPAITGFAHARNLHVIEDAAQAHGARWLGRAAGTFGDFGCFSMQHAKVLSCGEGGAVVTNDADVRVLLEELRADSRSFATVAVPDSSELIETASIMGSNFCLSDLSAAVLCGQLEVLDAQHARRNANLEVIKGVIEGNANLSIVEHDPRQTHISIYELPLVLAETLQTPKKIEAIRQMVLDLSGVQLYPPREPLHLSRLLAPNTKPNLGALQNMFISENAKAKLPNAEKVQQSRLLLHHSVLLGPTSRVEHFAKDLMAVTHACAT